MAKSRRSERRNKTTKLDEMHNRIDVLKREIMTIKLANKRASEVMLKFISVMQLLKDKGLITDDEITTQLGRNQESIVANSVQSSEAGTDEDHSGSEESGLLDTPSSGSDSDSDEP